MSDQPQPECPHEEWSDGPADCECSLSHCLACGENLCSMWADEQRDTLKAKTAQVEAWREAAYSGKRLLEYGATGEFSPEATRRLTDAYDSTWKAARALDKD